MTDKDKLVLQTIRNAKKNSRIFRTKVLGKEGLKRKDLTELLISERE